MAKTDDGKHAAASEARRIAHDRAQYDEGMWLGDIDGGHPLSDELIRRYNDAATDRRVCPHLAEDFNQPTFWVEAVPELLACKLCTPALAAEEQKRRNTCCIFCGRHTELRGVSVVAGHVLMRGGVCQRCEEERGLLSSGRGGPAGPADA